MSEPIPESIPTSADPRSKRAVKKRIISPQSQAASQIDSLFSRIDQVISIPQPGASETLYNAPQPPEIVQNVQGSSAGAGSGEFHVYKASRRREYERLRQMESQVEKERDDDLWWRQKQEREQRDREITRKKREKRDRMRQKKGNKPVTVKVNPTVVNVEDDGENTGCLLKPKPTVTKETNTCDNEDQSYNQETSRASEGVGIIIHDDEGA